MGLRSAIHTEFLDRISLAGCEKPDGAEDCSGCFAVCSASLSEVVHGRFCYEILRTFAACVCRIRNAMAHPKSSATQQRKKMPRMRLGRLAML